jgi:hypothetical protein
MFEYAPEPPGDVVRVRALKSFDCWMAGDEFSAIMNERLANLIVNNYLEELWRVSASTTPMPSGTADR